VHALVATSPGGPDRLVLTEVPDPEPAPGQALVKVQACGVCHFDAINREGAFPSTPFPAILGHEVGGEVVALGEGAHGVAVGDRVVTVQVQSCGTCGACNDGRENACRAGRGVVGESTPGGYAELVAIDARSLVPLPREIEMAQGAILACAAGTAYHALRVLADVTVGERVLVTGASGGVGVHAVQLARRAGARVIAVTTSADKEAELRALGAHDVVVAPTLDFAPDVKALTGGAGVDVVIEIVGARTFPSSLRSLGTGGRLVFVGNVSGEDVAFPPVVAIRKELRLMGSNACTRGDLAAVIELVRRGELLPVVDRVLPLADGAAAHELLDSRDVRGRIVLQP
jgi:acryloyl-coenzyme A reductase